MSHVDEGVGAEGAVPEAVEPPTNTAVTLRDVFSDAELDGLTQKELQAAIEDDRLTDRQLTRALAALGADTTVNAKQVHRQRLLAARRAQDERMRAPGDLIRTYSQSVEAPDEMAAVMIGLPSSVLAASLLALFREDGAPVEIAAGIEDKYMGVMDAGTTTPEALGRRETNSGSHKLPNRSAKALFQRD